MGPGNEFYTPTQPDSVGGWEDFNAVVEPFARVELSDTWAVKSSLRLEQRSIETVGKIRNRSAAGGASAQVKLGDTRRSVLEGGLATNTRWSRNVS